MPPSFLGQREGVHQLDRQRTDLHSVTFAVVFELPSFRELAHRSGKKTSGRHGLQNLLLEFQAGLSTAVADVVDDSCRRHIAMLGHPNFNADNRVRIPHQRRLRNAGSALRMGTAMMNCCRSPSGDLSADGESIIRTLTTPLLDAQPVAAPINATKKIAATPLAVHSIPGGLLTGPSGSVVSFAKVANPKDHHGWIMPSL